MSKKIVILASGNGSNAESDHAHFDSSTKIEVSVSFLITVKQAFLNVQSGLVYPVCGWIKNLLNLMSF